MPTLAGLTVAVAAPGAAFALFTAAPMATTAAATAAAIPAPAGFTATATSGAAATLSWTAPPVLTGYTLTQSPGTLAGCSATPSAATTTCTATGLSSNTKYTWTLTAAYNGWKSSSTQASATTAAVSATLVAKTTSTAWFSRSTTVTGVTTTSGAPLLILVYRQGFNSSITISSITGTAISSSSSPSQIVTQQFGSSSVEMVEAWRATGTGTSGGTVTVTFAAANNVTTTIDVVQLSGANASNPIAASTGYTNISGTTATGGSLSSVTAREVFFAGVAAGTTMSAPSQATTLDAPASGASGTHGSWFSSSASSSGITTTLGDSTAWATIEVAIQP